GSVSIEYVPAERCLESKALKFYLWAYRNEGAFCETLAARIADDVVYAIAPKAVRVEVHQNARGGIGLMAVAGRPVE
ncbi:MAG: 7-cyano-7-deazaguanine reductase, partial [Gemmatimonadetes bacterium]|nr:7-cyano-7-deazaguanine reductase [Gemmatimonadota bacterium]